MAGISTSIKIQDQMTPILRNITTALNQTLAVLGNLQDKVDVGLNGKAIASIQDNIRAAESALEEFEKTAQKGEKEVDNITKSSKGLESQLGKVAVAAAAAFAFREGKKFVEESLQMTNDKIRAEQQLANVMANQGASLEEYNAIKAKAAAMQKTTMYSSDAMMGGAGELSTYLKDGKAVEHMMGTLADYAAGMNGGTEASLQEMVNYATQLGKALDGNEQGLRMKGFSLSEEQKEIIKNGTDMQRALVIDKVISQSWNGLSKAMANTPLGKIAQVKNEISTLRAEFGERLYPAVLQVWETIKDHLPDIQQALLNIVPVIQNIISHIGDVVNAAAAVYNRPPRKLSQFAI